MISLLGSRYQIVREIGAGGMGRVFQAVDTQTGRTVAAKVLIAGTEDNLEALLRFSQEGAVLSTLKHHNIVEVYGTFLEEQICSIIMELLDGPSLADLLKTERLSLTRVKNLVTQVAAALHYSHGRGLVHRDIKPSNIMIVGGNRVKVTDFGIVRVVGATAALNTGTGMSLGTPLYMAPEQIEGQKVDGRADIYAMGAVMYHMVLGRPPFEGDDPLSIAFKHVHKPPQPPTEIKADIPADWEELILRMLAKDPADRFQTAAQLEEAISALSEQPATDRLSSIEQTTKLSISQKAAIPTPAPQSAPSSSPDGATQRLEPGRAPPQPPATVGPVKARRRPWVLPAGAVALVLAILIGLGVYKLTSSSGSPKTASTPITITRVPSTLLVQFGTPGARPGQFSAPQSVAVDRQGNIYVADWGNNRIEKLSGAGTPLVTWGGRRVGLGRRRFNHPSGVAVDARGNIYVADSGNSRVKKLSPRGLLLEEWGGFGTGPRQFRGLHSVTLDAQGDVYTTDAYNNRIQKFSPTGRVLAVWGKMGLAPGRFDQPVGLAINSAGNVYVADSKNHRIQEFTSNGKFLTQFKWLGGAGFPKGVALDSAGNIYIADYTHDLIQELSPTGKAAGAWGSRGSGPGQFIGPSSVWVDARGIVYVTDEGNDRIQKFGFGG